MSASHPSHYITFLESNVWHHVSVYRSLVSLFLLDGSNSPCPPFSCHACGELHLVKGITNLTKHIFPHTTWFKFLWSRSNMIVPRGLCAHPKPIGAPEEVDVFSLKNQRVMSEFYSFKSSLVGFRVGRWFQFGSISCTDILTREANYVWPSK
jgi:hypothetical protein